MHLQIAPSDQPLNRLPIRLDQSVPVASVLVRLAILVPALIIAVAPLALVVAHAAAEPAAADFLAAHPVATVQIMFAILLCAVLFVRPLQRTLGHAGGLRQVHIHAGLVQVTDRTLLSTKSWAAPLTSYRGIAQHVRTSLSGTRQEMVLVHPDAARHVLLAHGDRISSGTLADTASLLGLPQIDARALYPFPRLKMPTRLAPRLLSAQG